MPTDSDLVVKCPSNINGFCSTTGGRCKYKDRRDCRENEWNV